MAKRFLTKLIYSIMILQLLLCLVDRFPFLPTFLGIFSHFIYLGNMRRFPFVKLSDPLFLTSCGTCPCPCLVDPSCLCLPALTHPTVFHSARSPQPLCVV